MHHQVEVAGGTRTQNFTVGQAVRLGTYIAAMLGVSLEPREVLSAHCDPLPVRVPGSGSSAKYTVTGLDFPVYDWMLEALV